MGGLKQAGAMSAVALVTVVAHLWASSDLGGHGDMWWAGSMTVHSTTYWQQMSQYSVERTNGGACDQRFPLNCWARC
jgi:hypothetical protein